MLDLDMDILEQENSCMEKLWFGSSPEVEEVCSRLEFLRVFCEMYRWRLGMGHFCFMLSGEGLAMTDKVPWSLLELIPHVVEICKRTVIFFPKIAGMFLSEDQIGVAKVTLQASLVEDSPSFFPLPTYRGEDCCRSISIVGLLEHCFVCDNDHQFAAKCTHSL